MKHINTSTIAIIILYITLLCCNNNVIQTAHALEATFTPNPEDSIENGGDGGPLPVSMQQRKQLLELEAAIINSQDPAATLNHVAQQNNMSQEELAGMLERNHKDLQESGQLEGMMGEVNASLAAQQQQGSRSMSGSLPRRIVSLITSIILALIRTASVQISKNPKQSTLLFILLIASLLSIYNAPKNGIVISTGVFPPFCRGHTTLLEPPIDYLERYSVQSYERNGGWISSLPEATNKQKKKKKSKSNKQVGGVGMTSSLDIDTSNVEEGEVTVNTNRRVDGYTLITTASTLLTIDETDEEDEELQLEEIDCMHESIKAIIEERKFTEFIPGKDARSLKFRSFLIEDDMSEGAIFSMKLLGDFGRYGIQPLCISYEIDNDDDSDEEEESTSSPMTHCVAFHTLTGGHFDGELQFLVQETTEGDVISVTLAIPKGGRAPSTRLAESMVSSLTSSIAQSALIRTKQTLARRSQSKSYRTQATSRAKKKRHMRFEQEKLQEEMAAERKRKWKRNNKDVGRYRPTGCRGPSGGPKFGF